VIEPKPHASPERERALVPVLLAMTAAAGLVDAVSVLGLGRVFTANMTGNIVLLGFAAAGAPGLSFARSGAALLAFLLGAVIGGRISAKGSDHGPATWIALAGEAALLLLATGLAVGAGTDLTGDPLRLYLVIGLTGAAMGMRNAVVRKLAIPDLTTTVLTLTITGLAADSFLAGGTGPRSTRRIAAIASMLVGAAGGAWLVAHGVAWALAAAALISAACAVVAGRAPAPMP
jgi:uncharacterized membrane protein YoaK (UPF0700 family)